MKTHQLFAVACASAMLLVRASTFADLTDDERKCSDAFNKAARNIGNQEQKANRRCIKDNLTTDATSCVNGISLKATDKELKLEGLFLAGEKCDPVPVFGVNATAGGDDASKAAEQGTDDIIRALWGDPVDGVVLDSKCADAVAKRTGRIYDAILKAFRKCAKDSATIANIGTLEACVGVAISGAKVATFAGKLAQDVTNKCTILPEPGTEDGKCGGEITDAGYSGCATRVAKCNACLALNATTLGDADCDALDNGSSDGSCGAPVHKCTFDEAVDNSNLQLFVGGNTDLSSLVTDIAGAADLTCDPATQDVNGKRVCTCELQTWTPPQITGIGFICVEPGPLCPTGEADCDGGNALGIEAEDSSQIGSCVSHADCSAQCDITCAALGKVQWRSGCENLCQGGSRDGLACICDVVGSGGCTGGVAGTDDCPGGSCVGKNNEADQDCQCQCIDYAAGGASAPGAGRCNLSADIKVVASLPCSNPALVDLPPVCIPFSSQQSTGETNPANEGTGGGPIGPSTLIGTSGTCTDFDASTLADYTVVADIGFFDTTIGDVRVPLTIDCQ